MADFKYIIVGSGIAGLYAALLAGEQGSVLLLTKGGLQDCNTRYAQGGIAAAIGAGDSPALHLEDTLGAGAGLCDVEAARILTDNASRAIADLVRLGVIFDTDHGEVALGREGAHRLARVLHAGGDATGAHIETVLARLVQARPIRIGEHSVVVRLLADKRSGKVTAVEVVQTRGGRKKIKYTGEYIVLATGGAGQLFRHTTNPEVATGDGVALAFNAGAAVADMEFCQFHPTALRLPGAPAFLISEAVRGEGAVLLTGGGDAFMARYHPMKDLAPRDIVSRAIVTEMRRTATDHVLLDMTHLPEQWLITRFPTIYHTCLQNGVDITRDPVPVAPAAHYMMGGVLTNSWGETNRPGLFACGEVACNGLHGANRLASNSLLEALVFARRVVERTGSGIWEGVRVDNPLILDRPGQLETGGPALNAKNLVRTMWDKVGIVRDGAGLREAVTIFNAWAGSLPVAEDMTTQSLSNRVLVGGLMAHAALTRTESRGAHFRVDFPEQHREWVRRIVMVANSSRNPISSGS